MKLSLLTAKQSLNKAYLKEKVTRANIELFKKNLVEFLDSLSENEKESEEHVKNLITKFLDSTYYNGRNKINTSGRIDLAIYEEKKPVVIFEAKRPTSPDMVTVEDINKKATHELMLYYLQERVDQGNIDIKYLIITNTYEWFIFDASVFDNLFYKNNALMKDFIDWKSGRKARPDRDLFYNDIAKPFLKNLKEEIKFTWFNLKPIEKVTKKNTPKDDLKLIDLFKILSPVHLLKQPFANDSNSLDTKFYTELLHIIGLEEKKDGGKKIIQRKEKPDSASLLENAIATLVADDKLRKLPDGGKSFGDNDSERLFNVALELCITWINRVLFLKLLEGQLLNYHSGDKAYQFLDFKNQSSFDELNKLFFEVLAKVSNKRPAAIQKKYSHIPYLNSSLFDFTSIEEDTILIKSLDDSLQLKIASSTVLKTENGKKREGELPTLQYLFEFLDAYDFSSEGKEEIQEENKTLINASVLGLIFEKINGYKDGSFFTPGFITMYMCRETIRRAVVQRFNEVKKWKLENFEKLHNKIEDLKEANEIINSITICDPAVGSGHFLVSALNEIIAIKSELGVLSDRKGNRLREYNVEVVNDELIISIGHEEFFEYKPGNKESQRVQEALFHEKQTIIENCLFGVDLNPNSVKICRLRLWIELLKNAYYTSESKFTELETLPNIDINIKQGNSLISRFPLDADLSKALKSIKYSIDDYRAFVNNYKNATDKEEKRGFETLINQIKGDFRSTFYNNIPEYKKLAKLKGDLTNLITTNIDLFGKKHTENDLKIEIRRYELNIEKQQKIVDEIKDNAIFKEAFEWRFEFPEVLDNNGNFLGFDIVIGNPPYIRQEEFTDSKNHLKLNYKSFSSTADLLVYFIEKGISVLNTNGQFSFIVANKFLRAGFGKPLRDLLQTFRLREIIDFNDLPVFDEATTYPCILSVVKDSGKNKFRAIQLDELHVNDLKEYLDKNAFDLLQESLNPEGWNLAKQEIQTLIQKLKTSNTSLGTYLNGEVYYGIKTGLNQAFVINEEAKDQLITSDKASKELIKPFLEGKDVKQYQKSKSRQYLILIKNNQTQELFGSLSEKEAFGKMSERYPSIMGHLKSFERDAKKRSDQGQYWWELRPCDYYEKFEVPKIVYPNICRQPEFTFDDSGMFTNQKCFIIPLADKYLLGILNSSVTFFLFKNILPKLRGDFYEPSYVYFKDFPIAIPNDVTRNKIITLVDKRLSMNSNEASGNTNEIETEINQIVYQLYGLTKEEIGIIKGE